MDLTCTLSSLATNPVLKCSAPDGSTWWSPAIIGILGAVIGAAIGFVAQVLQAKKQEQLAQARIKADKDLKELDFKRTDEGIRRQLSALVAQIGTWVEVLRQHGLIGDYNSLRTSISQLNERIYKWEASTALSDEQAEALYRVSEVVGIAYDFVLRSKLDEIMKAPALDAEGVKVRDRAINATKGTFKPSCEALATFWSAMNDSLRAEQFHVLTIDIDVASSIAPNLPVFRKPQ
jgi:gas vesicle protein